ncbi:MAG: hypothetical protein FH753_06805 [Firmicutes bacterium]|nr:hypothetical protein [Bacillota bacterium]
MKVNSNSLKLKSFLLFIIVVFDYVLTYKGIQLGVIYEFNPCMVYFMTLPFNLGVILRILITYVLVKILKYGIEKNGREWILTGMILIQLVPYTIHVTWIYSVFSFVKLLR